MAAYDYILPPLLAQGSKPISGRPVPFDVVVLCAIERQDIRVASPTRTIHAPLNDDGSPMTKNEVKIAILAADRVTRLVQARKRVLVTCNMGRNRSGVVVGLALVNLGYTAAQATTLIRFARGPQALSNSDFRHILTLHERARPRRATAG